VNDQFDRRVGGLRTEIPPPPELWKGIESRLAPRARPRRRLVPLAWAASLLMVGVGSSLITQWWIGQGASQALMQTAAVAGEESFFGPEFMVARAELEEEFERRLETLPAESRAVVAGQLATIRGALAQIHAELGRDPGNALLQNLLYNTYHEEMALMADISRLAPEFATETEATT
jgi:hypothetical protein